MARSDTCPQIDLVNRIRDGNRQAGAELVERYSRGVMIIIRREVRDASVAEDLYQETFRIVLEKIRQGDVREPERLSGFVCGVARNLVIDYFRRAARQENMAEIEDALPLPHPAADQLQELLQKEKADLVRQVLKEMPNERDIQALYRFYIADDDREQVCADLGLTIPHFNIVLHRARERFRELYVRAMRNK
ncbi:MAG TPA: sigma-70 family RNA polymerase sigma factor [Blastocatellia bacterium]|nr:sigma-70 family RNA polymerase sigma factor [Blastocatellia bacterium]